jgi:hypothetical protein
MVRCLRLLIGVFVLWCIAPSRAEAHGAEYLGAKLRVLPDGGITLEVTADYGENPMLSSREEALIAVKDLLEIELEDGFVPWSKLAELKWEDRSQPDRSSPLPTDAVEKPHQLVTAIWAWQPPPGMKKVRFHVPKGVVQDTIFWLAEPGVDRTKQRWCMLLGGDSTPEIPLPERKRNRWPVLIGVIFAFCWTFWMVRRYRSTSA